MENNGNQLHMDRWLDLLKSDLNMKKQEALLKALYASVPELNGTKIESLFNRRFSPIVAVRKDKWEYWFYNDGSITGKFIVAFEDVICDTYMEGTKISAMINIKTKYNGEVDFNY